MTHKIDTPDIYESLRQKLITGAFTPGQKLKPADMIATYGCSINTLREVLLRLSTVGLVTFQDQRGFRARAVSAEYQHDLTTFRILLEQEGVSKSIARGGLEWESRVTAAHHKLSHIERRIAERGDVGPLTDLWCAAEWEFHDTLISACGSPMLRLTYARVYDQFRQQLVTRAHNYGYFPGNAAEHFAIVQAVVARDDALCRQKVNDHLARNLIAP